MTASTPGDGELDRIAEYVRQHAMQLGADPDLISSIWFDNNAKPVELRISDLDALVAEMRKLREREPVLEGLAQNANAAAIEAMNEADRLRAELASRPPPRVITTRDPTTGLPPGYSWPHNGAFRQWGPPSPGEQQ